MSYSCGQSCGGDELVTQIQTQLEDMFTDSYLAEGGFLLKHIQRNREGFVKLKLLTCFKKIKALTNNWYLTMAAALSSSQLEVSQDMSKVRRLKAYPEWLLRSPTSHLLLLCKLPADWTSSQAETPQNPCPGDTLQFGSLQPHILHRLSSYGTVTAFWILPPGQELPVELKCYAKRHRELGQSLCVVVKYNTLSAVRKAYDNLCGGDIESTGEGLQVVALGFKKSSMVNFPEPKEIMPKVELQEAQSEGAEGAEGARRREFCGPTRGPTYGPWLTRRRKVCDNKDSSRNMVRVIRQPRGPDGTRGYHDRRKK